MNAKACVFTGSGFECFSAVYLSRFHQHISMKAKMYMQMYHLILMKREQKRSTLCPLLLEDLMVLEDIQEAGGSFCVHPIRKLIIKQFTSRSIYIFYAESLKEWVQTKLPIITYFKPQWVWEM